MSPNFWIFADGSCGQGKNDLGAWTAIVITQKERKVLFGAMHPATVSRCELVPIIEGFRWLRGAVPFHGVGMHVDVYSDSEYTVKTLSGALPQQKNLDLWAAIPIVTEGFVIRWFWRERNSHYYMGLCDAICSHLRRATISTVQELLAPDTPFHDIGACMPQQEPPTAATDTLIQGLDPNANTAHG